jgi:hypothetical protein
MSGYLAKISRPVSAPSAKALIGIDHEKNRVLMLIPAVDDTSPHILNVFVVFVLRFLLSAE